MNEAFGFAVGARSIGLGKDVANAIGAANMAQGAGTVTRAVIGEQAANGDAELGIEAESGQEESGSGKGFFIGKNLGEGNAGMIIDGNVNILPADMTGIATAVAVDAMADAADTA